MKPAITIDKATLEECEEVIQRGLSSFIEVGNALLKIRDGKLYKATHNTFEDYCKVRWHFVRQQANRLIAAAEVAINLEPIGSKKHWNRNPADSRYWEERGLPMPGSESVTRPLTKLPPAAQQEVWKEAVETAPDGKVTAKHVEQTAQRWEPGTNAMRPASAEAKAADSESDGLFQLKRWWKKTPKKDRKKFLRWVKSSGDVTKQTA